jgi:O-6-methylguanine DNA methyltransferase
MSVIKSPAYKNMNETQLQAAIQLGEAILSEKADLVELDEESLRVRGKKGKRNVMGRNSGKMTKEEMKETERQRKVKQDDDDTGRLETKGTEEVTVAEDKTPTSDSEDHKGVTASENDVVLQAEVTSNVSKSSQTSLSANNRKRKHCSDAEPSPPSPPTKSRKTTSPHTLDPALQMKISSSSKTPFQKSVLSLLTQIPPGQYTTYALMSSHLSSSPRAVGNALRNNPFAPDVPCHRVLATGGGIGGFGGSWGKKGEAGKNDKEKSNLLRSEGVKFDGKGKALNKPWGGFR